MVATLSMRRLGRLARKSFFAGAHRLIAPERTVETVSRFASVMGITRVANVTGLDTLGLPVVMVSRPNSRSIAVSQGKGLTVAAAKASGLMESVEGYHAERITLPLKLASYEELRYTHNIVDVSRLRRPKNGIFHPNQCLLWIEGNDLLKDRHVWIPYEMVHLNYTLPLPPGTGCFIASSNGLASGNHLLEAISHAICEVVERDATALWRLKKETEQQKTRINLDSVDDPDCREVLGRYERASASVAVWETTSDIGIPTFFCLLTERIVNPLRPLPPARGYGCHPARSIALLRALTEAAQCRLTYISGSRDDLCRSDYGQCQNLDALQDESSRIESRCPKRDFSAVPTFDAATFNDDVAWELNLLRSARIDSVIAVNLTKPELGLPVVRVVIPGLEPGVGTTEHILGPRALAILRSTA